MRTRSAATALAYALGIAGYVAGVAALVRSDAVGSDVALQLLATMPGVVLLLSKAGVFRVLGRPVGSAIVRLLRDLGPTRALALVLLFGANAALVRVLVERRDAWSDFLVGALAVLPGLAVAYVLRVRAAIRAAHS